MGPRETHGPDFKYIVEVEPTSEGDGQHQSRTGVFRNYLVKDGWKPDYNGCTTLYDLFTLSTSKFATRPCHGRRPIHPSTGEAGPYVWQTYREVAHIVEGLAKVLASEGCKKRSPIGIYGPNAPEWGQTMEACSYFSGICVPIYDSLGADVVEFVIDHSEMEFVFCADRNYACLLKGICKVPPGQCKLRGLCVWGDASVIKSNSDEEIKKMGIRIWTWQELMTTGGTLLEKDFPPNPPSSEDICTYMYTSGTTGKPKGVIITHRALLSTVGGMLDMGEEVDLSIDNEVYLSFLTLAHIYGRVVEEAILATGGKIGYWQGDIRKLPLDIAELRPTIFTGVPRVWERIHDKVMDRLSMLGTVGKCIYDTAVEYKYNNILAGYKDDEAAPWLDTLLFKGLVQRRLGGRVKFVASGAAPLSPYLEKFIRVALGTHGGQGYGLTETMGATCVAVPNEREMIGTVGIVLPSMEFCLESVPEMGYHVDNPVPQGELCFRGPGLFSGYYKNSEEHKKVVDGDGFFHTGDIAELHSCGALKIIDRKKNIFKLSQGEYVAVEKIECALQQASAVGQIWVYGSSLRSCLVAVVVPHISTMQSEGFPASITEICADEGAQAFILKQLGDVAKSAGLKGFEKIKGVILESEEFSVDNNCMTPSFKLKRHELLKKYQKRVDDLYNQIEK